MPENSPKSSRGFDWESARHDILSRIDLRAEAESFGVVFTAGEPGASGWLPCHAVGREDKSPSAAICVSSSNGSLGLYKDSAAEGHAISFFELAAKAGRFPDWKAARDHYARQAGVELPEGVDLDAQVRWRPWNRNTCRLWCEHHKAGLTLEQVEAFGAALCQWPARLPEPYTCLAIPSYRDGEHPTGWVLFRTDGDSFAGTEKLSVRKVHNLKGSGEGWVNAGGPKARLAATTVWRVEGPTDAIALQAILPLGHVAVSNITGAGADPNRLPLEWMAGKSVRVIGDADKPGESGARRHAAAFARIAADVRVVKLPYPVEEKHGKDVRDWVAGGGTFEGLLELEAAGEAVAATSTTTAFESDNDRHKLARSFLAKHAAHPDGYRLRFWREEFYEWSNGSYKPVGPQEIRAKITASIKDDLDLVNAQRVHSAKEDSKPALLTVTQSLVGDVINALKSLVIIAGRCDFGTWIGNGPGWEPAETLPTQNSLVHLPSFVRDEIAVIPSTPAYFSPNSMDYEFAATAARPERWLSFLDALWPDEADFVPSDEQAIKSPNQKQVLQEWFGYCLLPDTSQQKILFMLGPTRSGKGTIARVLRALIGNENVVSPTLSSLATNFGLSPLLGKTLAFVADARLSGRADIATIVERLLSISGEDAITVDRKNLSPITVKLSTRFLILSNEVPKFTDASGALANRMLLLSMSRSWKDQEDKNLSVALLAELPGILLWSIAGWERLRRRGRFIQPKENRSIITEMIDLGSPTVAFVRERCVTNPGLSVRTSKLFDAWKKWCEETGNQNFGTVALLGRNLRAVSPHIETKVIRVEGDSTKFERYFDGIAIQD